MNIRLLPLLLAAVLTGSGCYYDAHDSGPADGLWTDGYGPGGNITFAWSFAGKSCSQAGVQTVVVDMPGQYLQNNGRYPCTTSSYDGITLANFVPGTYPYTLSAYDAAGRLTYQASGQVLMTGMDDFETVDLGIASGGSNPGDDAGCTGGDGGTLDDGGTPPGGTIPGGTGVDGGSPDAGPVDAGIVDAGSPDAGSQDGGSTDAGSGGGTCGCGHPDGGVDGGTYNNYVSWSFPQVTNAPTCGDELAQVILTIDGQTTIAHECGAGLWPSRVTLPTLTPGTHPLRIDAVDGAGNVWATTQVSIDIASGASTYQTYQVPWIVGSAAIDWTFFSCDGALTYSTCAQAGVDTMAFNFQDSSGNWLYADAHGYPVDDRLSCSDTGRAVLRAVTPGSYTAFVAGYGTRESGIIYDEYPGQSSYPLTVQAGVFFTASSPASDFVSVDLYQQ